MVKGALGDCLTRLGWGCCLVLWAWSMAACDERGDDPNILSCDQLVCEGRARCIVLAECEAEVRAAMKAGVKDWSSFEFYSIDLSALDMQGVDFDGAIFVDVSFSDSNLYDSDWEAADLRGANFRGADLREANLNEAQLAGADFTNANMQHANLAMADLRGASFNGVDLTGAHAYAGVWDGVTMSGAILDGMMMNDLEIGGADLRGALMRGLRAVNLRGCPAYLDAPWVCTAGAHEHYTGNALVGPYADLTAVIFKGNDLSSVDLSHARLFRATFDGVLAENLIATGAEVTEATLRGNFRGADFRGVVSVERDARAGFGWDTFEDERDETGAHNWTLARFNYNWYRSDVLWSGDFSGADFSDANLRRGRFEGDFSDATFVNALFDHATFAGADFSTADFSDAPTVFLMGCDASLPTGRWCVELGRRGPSVLTLQGDEPVIDWHLLDFRYANLAHAWIENANWDDLDLTGVILSHATLRFVSMARADLLGARFVNSTLWSVTLDDTIFRHAELYEATISRTTLSGADFSKASMRKMQAGDGTNTWDRVIFDRADLSYADFANATWTDVSAQFADLVNTNLYQSILTRTDFTHALLNRARFTEATLTGSIFDEAWLRGTTLRNVVDGSSASWQEVRWENTQCPDGSNSNENGDTCEGYGL